MPGGLFLGLGAAVAWGITDVTAALGGRRFGSLRVVVATQSIGLVAVGTIALVGLLDGGVLPALDGRSVAVAALCGLFANVAYVAFFTALRIGPISIVSPTVSAYGGLTVLLAVAFLGETMSSLQVAGAAIATIGVVLVGLTFDGGLRNARLVGPGVLFGIVALVGFASLTVTMAEPIRTIGWLPALIISRATNALLGIGLLVVAIARPRRWTAPFLTGGDAPAGPRSISPTLAVVLAGLLDVGGLISFAIGLQTSMVWLVGLASSFGPVFAVALAVLVLGERPRPAQWLGMAAILLGIAVIGQARPG